MPASSIAQSARIADGFEISPVVGIRKLAKSLAGEDIWSGSAGVAVRYGLGSRVGLEAQAFGAAAPQLNFKNSAVLNERGASTLISLSPWGASVLSPYLYGGVTHNSFRYDESPVGEPSHATFTGTLFGLGLRWAAAPSIAIRVDGGAEKSSYGTTFTSRMGLGLAIPRRTVHSPEPLRIVHVDTVRVESIVRVTDTLRVPEIVRLRDTIRVHDTVVVARTKEVTKTVAGADVILTLKDASFDFAQAVLRPEALAPLDSLAEQLKAPGNKMRIRVVGHTDSIGSAESNRKLGLKRARAVALYLELHGVPAERMEAATAGRDSPIATNATEAGRQLNRRVVISRAP